MSNLSNNVYDPIIKTSLEYYDSFQPKINDLISKIEYIEFVNNQNITDQVIFYDANHNKIFESLYEILSIYIPQTNIWKWSWSLPTAPKKHTFITRKILDYAFNLDHEKDYLLKSTLINSKIKIINDIQLDIHIALSAKLSKKPFVFKFHSVPIIVQNHNNKDNISVDIDEQYNFDSPSESNENDDKTELDYSNKNSNSNIYPYRKIMQNKNLDQYLAVYLLILNY